ncbi:MAG: tetratricopeptide repeat protein [Nannocystaceae bacterium]
MHQLDAIGTLLDQGAADSAVRLLRSCWEPELPPSELTRMYCLWIRGLSETGEMGPAVTLAQRAASEFPRHPDILIALGNVLDLVGDYDGAKVAFESAIDADPTGPLQRYNLGAILERLGDEDGAEQAYQTANNLDAAQGPMVEATSALGALLRRQGRIEESEQVYDAYLMEDPLHVEMLVEHGICLSDLERFEEAIERFDFALSVEPEHSGALYNKAITLFRLACYDDAIKTLDAARHSDPLNPLTLAVLGSWRLGVEAELDLALSHLYRALDLLLERHVDPLSAGYASVVVEEIFEALWQSGRRREAREVARIAGRHEWITPHIFDCINEADYGRSPLASSYEVLARAEAFERPEHWPENCDGYTTGLTVVACDADEARKLTIEYLRAIETTPGVRFHVDVKAEPPRESGLIAEGEPLARGVARVTTYRAYNFRSRS